MGDCKQTAKGWNYTGTVSVTREGWPCQRWDEQSPHGHSYTDFPDATLAEAANYCRTPDKNIALWCYISDPSGPVWDFCLVPLCGM